MKSYIFWDLTPCIPSKVNCRFGGTCRRNIQALAICFHAGFLPGLFFDLQDGGGMFLRNVG
jgi:hypothetical protein